MRNFKYMTIALILLFSMKLKSEVKIGQKPPPFRLFAGEKIIDLTNYLGAIPIVISFFSTTCRPCKREIPFLHKKSHNNTKFKLILVVTDTGNEGKIKKFLKSIHKKFENIPYIYDPYGKILKDYNDPKKLPYTIYIGKSGKVVSIQTGYSYKKKYLLKKIIKLLQEK